MAWRTDRWWTSPYNWLEEVRARYTLPKNVTFHDVTLRDGEQQPGIVFRKEDKVKIAHALDAMGVQRIEAGMPAVSAEDFDAVKTIANAGLNAKVMTFCRARRDDVDLALKCGAAGVVIEVPSSKALFEKGFLWTENRVYDMCLDSLSYAKKHGLYVVFFPYDTTRADWSFVSRLMTMGVKEAHVDALAVIDTFGCTLPDAFTYLVKKVKDLTGAPVEVHTHNDYGLAAVNSIAGVCGGAEVVHGTINGLGERCGNAPLEEVAMGLLTLLGIDAGIRYEKIVQVSELVRQLAGVTLSPGKPIVGENCLTVESGISAMFAKRLSDAGALTGAFPYLPELVGQQFRIVLGKKSGTHSIAAKLQEIGVKATEEQMDQMLTKVKALSMEKRGLVTKEEFIQMVNSVLGRE